MAPPKHVSYQNLLDTMRDEKHSLRAEVTKLSISPSPSSLADRILLLLDYLQIISSILLCSLNFERNQQESALLVAVKFICQLANPASWIPFDDIGLVEVSILCLFGLFTVVKYLLFGYIVLVARLKVKPFQGSIQIWRFLFRIQGRFLYFVTSSLWMNAISAFQSSQEEWTSSQYYGALFTSCLMVALEFLFTFYLKICHFKVLPSRKFLSAKDNVIETLILIQKLILQIFVVTLDLDKLFSMWIFTLVNFMFDILRDCYHFGTLPFYSFKALSFQAMLLMVTTSLNISCVVECIAISIDDRSSLLFQQLAIWMSLSVLSVKFSLGYIDRRFWDVITNPLMNSPGLLIHRVFAIEQIQEMTTSISEYHDKNSLSLLLLETVSSRAQDILKLDSEFQVEGPIDINNRDLCNRMFEHYFRKLNKSFPKNKFIQLCTAQFQIERLKTIRDPTGILHKLIKSSDRKIVLSAELLRMEVQELLREKYENPTSEESLDMRKFMHEQILFAEVKQKVIEQADLQIRICKQVKKEAPDLAQIFSDSQKLATCRQNNKKAIRSLLSSISDSHISPLLFCARYHLILNHSIHDNLRYMKMYSKRLQKYQRFFNDDKLITENMFSHDVGFMLFSNNEPTVGKTIYVSKGFAKRVGQDNDSLMTMNILKNVPPCLYEARLQFHNYIAEYGERVIPDTITRGFVYSKQGYLVELDFYVNIHPFLSSDFCVSCIERGVVSNREYIYVLENGEIDCTTQRLGQRLGLKPNLSGLSPGTNFKLSNISQELALINEAFNMVFFEENPETKRKITKSEKMGMKEARDIYSAFSVYGADILLNSVTYRCQITNQYLGNSLLKLITLEEKSKKFQTGDPESPRETVRKHYHIDIAERQNKKNLKKRESFDSICDEKNLASRDTVRAPQKSLKDDDKTGRYSSIETTAREKLLTMMTSSREKGDFKDSAKEKKPTTFSESTGGKNIVQQDRTGEEGFAVQAASVDTSKLSKTSHQKRVFHLYKISLNTKYTPKTAKIFLYIFWLSLIIALLSQVLMKITLDQNVGDLSVKKEIVRCAQSRNHQLIKVASYTRILWDVNSGALSTSALDVLFGLFLNYPKFITGSFTELNNINNELLLDVSSLNKEIYQAFFTKDVRVYDSYFEEAPEKYDYFDSFQATNRIIETASSIITSQGIKNSTTENLVHFVTRNSLNDLLIKNQEITQILLTSGDNQRSQIRTIIYFYFIGLVVLLSPVVLTFIAYSWKQHIKQVINLSAFCRLHPIKLNGVYDTFVSFKTSIENDEPHNAAEYYPTAKKSSAPHQSPAKREHKNPNSVSLRKSQILFAVRFVSVMFAMFIFIIIASNRSNSLINTTKALQSHLYLLDYSQNKISLAATLFLELTATNNIAEAENAPVLERLQEMENEIYQMKKDLYIALIDAQKNLKSPEDFEQALAGEEACDTIEKDMFKSLCLALQSRGYKPGLVFLLTSFDSILKEQVTKYQESNKTTSSLTALLNEEFETTRLISMVVGYQLDRLARIIDGTFEEKIEETHHQRRNIMVVFILIVIVLGFILWKYLLIRLREGVNQFKNVLAVLPADLVLGNLRLRAFLMKTSGGALDTVKNELNYS